MQTFKTLEELIEFVSDQKNIKTLDNGEVTIKEWNEDAEALRKYWRQYGQTTSDRKAWDSQKQELIHRVVELTEQLDSARDELAGLKEIHGGDDKEILQKLNAEIAVIKAKNIFLEKQVATIPDMKKQVEEWNLSRIVEAAKRAAVSYKVPENIITDPAFETIVAADLTIDDMGNVFVKGDSLQSVHDYIAVKQRDRPHWKPLLNDELSNDGKVSDDLDAIASLYSQSGSSGRHTQPINRDYTVSDELAAVAALFG
jgi:hypothetical protein